MAAHFNNQKDNYQAGNSPEESFTSSVLTRSRSKILASQESDASGESNYSCHSNATVLNLPTSSKRKQPKRQDVCEKRLKSKRSADKNSNLEYKTVDCTNMNNNSSSVRNNESSCDDANSTADVSREILHISSQVDVGNVPPVAASQSECSFSNLSHSHNSEILPCAIMCSSISPDSSMVEENSLNLPCRSFVSYSEIAEAQAEVFQCETLLNNASQTIDVGAHNLEFLDVAYPCAKSNDKNYKRQSSLRNLTSEELGESSLNSKASTSKPDSRKISIKVPKLERAKSSRTASNSVVNINNCDSAEQSTCNSSTNSGLKSGLRSALRLEAKTLRLDAKAKNDAESISSSKLTKTTKGHKTGDTNKKRQKQVPSSEKSGGESVSEQMETCGAPENKKESVASNTVDFMSNLRVPVISEMSFLSDSGASSSSAGEGFTTSTPSRENVSSESELGRLQALLEARGIPLHIFGSLGHRVQHLFNRSLGSSSNSRAQQLLQGLQAAGDEGRQLQAVIEMCQLLVMGNEDTLIGFPFKQVVPVLIDLLSMEHNFEIMHNACRALTYLMEALPRSSSAVVEAVPAFLNKLQFIQCMDVAEQALTALEMLSKWHSKSILHAKGIAVCLMYLDFFSINAQRTALSITANCCQNILHDEFSLVQESLPLLSGWLRHQDEKSVESICLAFSRLVDCLQYDSKCLKEIASNDLIHNIQQLLVIFPTVISTQTFTSIIRMLALMCASCSELAVLLLKHNISNTICYLLTGTSDYSHDFELSSRTPQELYEISYLICELMPPLPNDGIYSINSMFMRSKNKYKEIVVWKWRDDDGVWHLYQLGDSRAIETAYQAGKNSFVISVNEESSTIDFNTMELVNSSSNTKRPVLRLLTHALEVGIVSDASSNLNPKIEPFKNDAELVNSCIKSLFPVLYEVYSSTAGPTVRYNCLRSMLRMLHFAPPEILSQVLKSQMISRHIAAMLASSDYKVVVLTIQMAEILMLKLPDVFGVSFIREGVLHEIKLLSSKDLQTKQQETSVEENSIYNPTLYDSSEFLSGRTVSLSEGRRLPIHFVPVEEASSSSTSIRSDEGAHNCISIKVGDYIKKKRLTSSNNSAKETCVGQSSISSYKLDFNLKINTWIKEQAQSFESKHFSIEKLHSTHPAVNVLNQLSSAVIKLDASDGGLQALFNIRTLIMESDISTFELIHSGLIKKLRLYLTSCEGNNELEHHLRSFLHVFIGSPLSKYETIEKLNSSSLSIFINKLNACISHLEQFAVKVHDHPSYGFVSRRGTSYKYLNAHQLKCTFQRHPDCSTLRQWRGGPVMVDPLALIQSIDRYLVNHGYGVVIEDDDDDDEEDEDEEDESDPSDEDNSDEEIDDLASAIRIHQEEVSHKLQLLIGDNVLPYNLTVYQALRQFSNAESRPSDGQELDGEDSVASTTIWDRTHVILYRPIPAETNDNNATGEVKSSLHAQNKADKKKRTSDCSTSSHGNTPDKNSKVSKGNRDENLNDVSCNETNFLTVISNFSESNAIQDPSIEVIYLLRVIHALNSHWGSLYLMNSWEPAVHQADFINVKLTLKANRQLQDVLAVMTGNVPAWLSHVVRDFPFLFPFQTRYLLFYVISFDRERALQRLLDVFPEMRNSEKIVPKLDRKKKTVSRDSILKQAEAVLQDVGKSKAMLEIQYKNEVGTGLGPTLEFYALVSKELQRAELEMWRGEKVAVQNGKGSVVNYVYNCAGLFPVPLPLNVKSSTLTKVCNKFRLLGNVLAKAIMDFRLLDIPLSLAFYKWMLNKENDLSLADLMFIDESFAQTVFKLEQIVIQKKKLENNKSLSAIDLKSALENLSLDGCSLEDLSLDFTLPGYPHIEMKKSGKDNLVTIHNLEEYLKLLKHWIMKEGISRQMKAFQEGFESVFPLSNLKIFYADEMELLFCGSKYVPWDVKSLKECCRPDHGFTFDSPAIKFFFSILSTYDQEQQRKFLQFLTGSPRLPVGGLKALSPLLTIVKKTSDDDANRDCYLPSVMTCVNYLKLPDYSSLEIMRAKLEIAINEGQNSFHLS
ncbi:E3 ubiquitin-protein ligase TRIP12-like [Uloborus diversus]|uniref:E3 ubiquitin-protein ligase TRIP12-like n=1 Tax=Uloborus diversus TaxID=327109 RepID=UPI00240A260A|nr:E3 ubiquitin-protein ligase TRIP12-like [Uloborus diversus]